MIDLNQCFRLTLLLCVLALPAGCSEQTEDAEVQLPDWLAEDASESSDAPTPPSSSAADAAMSVAPDDLQRTATAASGAPGPQLQPGDRFPIRKVVEQQLQQSSLDGQPQISRSRLELLLTISVADVRDGHTFMQVQYDRIRYSHDVAGEQVEYDSTQPAASIPPAVLAYHGMVGDGFAYWVDPANKVTQAVGVREFVERCLAHVPPEQRQQAMLSLEATAGEHAVAGLVDNTIGLLPGAAEQIPGTAWEETQHLAQPVPMQINTVYTLANVTDSTAEVTVSGSIVPSTALGTADTSAAPVQIVVNGGSSSGHCMIDRHSGLPTSSQIERIVDMTVQMDGGIEFAQQKRTLTTIEALPQQRLAAHEGRPQFR